jgi:hypothetical protein
MVKAITMTAILQSWWRLKMERRYGIPLADVERVANHYGITLEEAEALLEQDPVEELLPERGYGLQNIGQGEEEEGNMSGLPLFLAGFVMGGIIGCGFAMILHKGEKG